MDLDDGMPVHFNEPSGWQVEILIFFYIFNIGGQGRLPLLSQTADPFEDFWDEGSK